MEDSPAGKKILALVETKEKEIPTRKQSKVHRDGTGSSAGHIGRLLIIFCFYTQLVLRNDGLGGMTLLQSLLADTDFNGIFKIHDTKKSRCIKRDAAVFDGHDKTDYHIL